MLFVSSVRLATDANKNWRCMMGRPRQYVGDGELEQGEIYKIEDVSSTTYLLVVYVSEDSYHCNAIEIDLDPESEENKHKKSQRTIGKERVDDSRISYASDLDKAKALLMGLH